MSVFSAEDYWRAIILYGLNQATYKIALGKSLIALCEKDKTVFDWSELSSEFLRQYRHRLNSANPMPQQAISSRRTVMEKVVSELQLGLLNETDAVEKVGIDAFNDVIHRFHTVLGLNDTQGKFYSVNFGRSVTLTDDLYRIVESSKSSLLDELNSRWSLLEGAFSIKAGNYQLANEIRETYLLRGTERKSLTKNVPFLQGYQGNVCFYCGEEMRESDIHVDHVLPRQVVHHDELWNLVLAHSLCNERKSDALVPRHYMAKLSSRNENIIGSNHPWKKKLIHQLGETRQKRSSEMMKHFDRVKTVLGPTWWESQNYNPETDPFYRRLITVINNQTQ